MGLVRAVWREKCAILVRAKRVLLVYSFKNMLAKSYFNYWLKYQTASKQIRIEVLGKMN